MWHLLWHPVVRDRRGVRAFVQLREDVGQFRVQTRELRLRHAFLKRDLVGPDTHFRGCRLGRVEAGVELLDLLLSLDQEIPGAGNTAFGIGPGQVAGQVAHLAGHFEHRRLQFGQIGMIVQIGHAFAHRIKFGPHLEHPLAV